MCFDNDKAGDNAINELSKMQVCGVDFTPKQPAGQEDWNDVLKMRGVK